MALRHAVLACHIVLMIALGASILAPPTPLRLAAAALALVPLLLTLRGLAGNRRITLQRLAVLLVAYIGGTSVEVVAHSGNAPLMSAALLAAVLELGLALALIRRRAARE
jgi:hypothetical protein